MKKAKIYKDKELDTCWITLVKGQESYCQEIAPGFSLEYNDEGKLIGIEIQNFSRLSIFNPLQERISYRTIAENKTSGFNPTKDAVILGNDIEYPQVFI